MSIRHYVVRSREILLCEGVGGYLKRVFSRCKEGLYGTNEAFWFCRDISEPIQGVPKELEPGFEVCVDKRMVSWLRERHKEFGWLYIPEEIDLKQKEGHIYLAATFQKEIVGYIKIGVNRVYVLDYEQVLGVPKQTAMIYDTFVLPAYRRRGLSSHLINESIERLRTKGYRNLWCHIPPWNEASIGTYSRAGFQRVARIRFMRILRWRFYSCNVGKMIDSKERLSKEVRLGVLGRKPLPEEERRK